MAFTPRESSNHWGPQLRHASFRKSHLHAVCFDRTVFSVPMTHSYCLWEICVNSRFTGWQASFLNCLWREVLFPFFPLLCIHFVVISVIALPGLLGHHNTWLNWFFSCCNLKRLLCHKTPQSWFFSSLPFYLELFGLSCLCRLMSGTYEEAMPLHF